MDVTTAEPVDDAELQLAQDLFAAVALLRRQTRQIAGQTWSIESLTGAQLELLHLLRRQPGIAVTEAASGLGLATNTVSTLVAKLSEAGLVRKARDTRDHRVTRLRLTPTAQRRAALWHDRRALLTADALTRLTPEQHVVLEHAVSAITDLAAALPDANVQSSSPIRP